MGELILRRRSQKPDRTLYHYTSAKGLIGILQERELWATDIHFLNDSQEFAYAFELANRLALKKLCEPTQADLRAAFVHALSDLTNLVVCVGSFSEQGDQLSQWRGYCAGGGGYCLGFDPGLLQQAQEAKQEFYLYRCTYDPVEQEALVEELLDDAVFEAARTPVSPSRTLTAPDVIGRQHAGIFTEIAPMLKHPSFSEEQEWRLVSKAQILNHPRLSFRPGRPGAIPYFRYSLADPNQALPLTDIIVGPTPHASTALQGAEKLLVNATDAHTLAIDWKPPRVRLSAIPYRDW